MANLLGFVSLVLQVATTADSFIRNSKNFPEEFIRLCTDTKEFAALVKRLEPAITVVEGRYSAEPDGIMSKFIKIADQKRKNSRLWNNASICWSVSKRF